MGDITTMTVVMSVRAFPIIVCKKCYDAIPALQAVKPLTLAKSLGAQSLNLHDEEQRKMVSFKSLKRRQLR
jgi:hypothetical protein